MIEMDLREPGSRFSVRGTFTKNKEKIQKFKETEDLRYIYQNELDKACFQHEMDYGNFRDLSTRTAANKIIREEALNTAKDAKYCRDDLGIALVV